MKKMIKNHRFYFLAVLLLLGVSSVNANVIEDKSLDGTVVGSGGRGWKDHVIFSSTGDLAYIEFWSDNNGVIRFVNKANSTLDQSGKGRPVLGTVIDEGTGLVELNELSAGDVISTPNDQWAYSGRTDESFAIITSPTHTKLHGKDTYIGFMLQKQYTNASNEQKLDTLFAYIHIEVAEDGRSVRLREIVYEDEPRKALTIVSNIELLGLVAIEKPENTGALLPIDLTLKNGVFAHAGELDATADFTIEGVPAGLTANIVVNANDLSRAQLVFYGNADSHTHFDQLYEKVKLKLNNSAVSTGDASSGNTLSLSVKFIEDKILNYTVTSDNTANDTDNYKELLLPFLSDNYEIGSYTNSNNNGSRTNHLYSNENRVVVISQDGFDLKSLNKGFWIDESLEWKTANNYPDYPYLVNDYNGKTIYIGIEINDFEQLHYGWIKVSVAEDGQSVTHHEYGIQSMPNTPIQVGQTDLTTVLVSDMHLTSSNNLTTVGIYETLQMNVDVIPAQVSNKNVIWSVENGTGEAYVSKTGLLTGISEGTVEVKVIAEDNESLVRTMNIVVTKGALGVSESGLNHAKIYPIPFSDYIYIEGVQEQKVTIYDVAGKQVKSLEKGDKIKTADLEKGVYFIHYKENNQTIIQKIIKQ